jgi:hypothetical protein
MDLPVVISGFVVLDVMLSAQVGLAVRDLGKDHPAETSDPSAPAAHPAHKP